MDFTEKELWMILHCLQTSIEWSIRCSEPDFYDTLDCIALKCKMALNTDSSIEKVPVSSRTVIEEKAATKKYVAPKVSTSLKDILSGISINY